MASADSAETDTLREQVRTELERHLSAGAQQQATVEAADPETGTVVLSFGCGCSGGLAPPERARVRTALVERVAPVDAVRFGSGCGCGSGHRGHGHGHSHESDSADGPEAPF